MTVFFCIQKFFFCSTRCHLLLILVPVLRLPFPMSIRLRLFPTISCIRAGSNKRDLLLVNGILSSDRQGERQPDFVTHLKLLCKEEKMTLTIAGISGMSHQPLLEVSLNAFLVQVLREQAVETIKHTMCQKTDIILYTPHTTPVIFF